MVNLFPYPEEKSIIYWMVGRSGSGPAYTTYDITIYFTSNAASASRLEQRFVRLAESFGFFKGEVPLGRFGTIVWSGPADRPITARQASLLKRCLGG
jgi:hypothetical protein